MAQFRNKPVVIEAWQIPPNDETTGEAPPPWLLEAVTKRKVITHSDGISILTEEGVHVGMVGDWIIRGTQGDLSTCRAADFAETYELVPPGP